MVEDSTGIWGHLPFSPGSRSSGIATFNDAPSAGCVGRTRRASSGPEGVGARTGPRRMGAAWHYNGSSTLHFGLLTASSTTSTSHCPHEPQGGPNGAW